MSDTENTNPAPVIVVSANAVPRLIEGVLDEAFKVTQYALVVGLISYGAHKADDVRTDALAWGARVALVVWFWARMSGWAVRFMPFSIGMATPIWLKVILLTGFTGAYYLLTIILNEIVFAGMASAL